MSQVEQRAGAPAGGAAQHAAGGERLGALDAARGLSMGLVFLAHFAQVYPGPLAPAWLHAELCLAALTQLASPSFMGLSGLLLGFSHARRPAGRALLRTRCADRGLFLLTVGHLLILPTHLQWIPEGSSVPRILFITDTVGVALLLVPALMARVGARGRAALGVALLLASWTLLLRWDVPPLGGWALLKHALVGPEGVNSWVFNFPLLPWLGLFLLATCLGEWVASAAGEGARIERRLVQLGAGALLLGAGLGAVHVLLRRGSFGPGVAPLLVRLGSPFQKLPPGPTYFAVYAGLGLLALALLMRAQRRGQGAWLLAPAAQLGRHSLIAFVAQYYVYYGAVRLLRPQVGPLWPLLFAASVLPLLGFVRWWEAGGHGAWLTVGLHRPRRPASEEEAAPGLPPAT